MNPTLNSSRLRVVFVISSFSSGGISPVCIHAAQGLAKHCGFACTVLGLYGPALNAFDEKSNVRMLCLEIVQNSSRTFLNWLQENPQDVIFTNDVSKIESCFPYLPRNAIHIIGLHDHGRRYLDAVLRNRQYIDGVWCVARNVEEKLHSSLGPSGFSGLIKTVYNGAEFPGRPERHPKVGPMGLLFMGRMDPLTKGIFDLVPIIDNLRRLGVPFKLTIAGGRHKQLESRFRKHHLEPFVSWAGAVPREECYRLASQNEVLLMTSRREPFGMVTIEAMSMGCVPFAYDIPSGSREIIEHNKSGLLLPLGNFYIWADSIKKFYENPQSWLKLSQAAMNRAREHFNRERLATGMVDFLNAVLSNAEVNPSKREMGAPKLEEPLTIQRTYRRLPAGLREWVRSTVGSSPKLSWWWLSR
jgi:glycosyltransferase involved in cell wall biosynthesis